MSCDDAIEKNMNNFEHVDFLGSVRYDNLVILYHIWRKCFETLWYENGILYQVLRCTLGQTFSWVCKSTTMTGLEHRHMNYAKILPYYTLTD